MDYSKKPFLCRRIELMKQLSNNQKLTLAIVAAMLGGGILGYFVHHNYQQQPEILKSFSENIKLLSTIFIRLVQMIIAPLVFCTLVAGIAKMGDKKLVGRVGGKALLWFVTASLVSLLLGLLLVNFFKPGVGNLYSITDSSSAQEIIGKTQSFSLQHFVEHLFPKSFIMAMAENEILQLVVFSLFFAFALLSFGEKGKNIAHFLDMVGHVVLKMVTYVMYFAPLGVFGSIAAVIAKNGLGILGTYGKYISSFYVGLLILWIILIAIGYFFLKKRIFTLLSRIKNAIIIAFSTTSSESVFPKLTEELERFGCNKKLVSFVLPLGYSFNLDGSMMYMTFASIFISQVYNIELDLGTQLTMLFVLMLTSKGIAGVPRASLVVVTATCAMFNIPPEGIALILPLDHFCDMGRSATNVLGNSIAIAALDKMEGKNMQHYDG